MWRWLFQSRLPKRSAVATISVFSLCWRCRLKNVMSPRQGSINITKIQIILFCDHHFICKVDMCTDRVGTAASPWLRWVQRLLPSKETTCSLLWVTHNKCENSQANQASSPRASALSPTPDLCPAPPSAWGTVGMEMRPIGNLRDSPTEWWQGFRRGSH